CHAAIIARELGIPAAVGCGDATESIPEGAQITGSCAEGHTGFVYDAAAPVEQRAIDVDALPPTPTKFTMNVRNPERRVGFGAVPFEQKTIELDALPPIPTKIMMNVGNPDRAFDFAGVPNHGVGLARLEFISNRMIGVHPRALLEFDRQPKDLQETIRRQMSGSADPVSVYIDKLCEGIATIAPALAPQPVIVRLSDFKSNEYANLIGGRQFEPHEENPMLGFRGASRYVDESFRP